VLKLSWFKVLVIRFFPPLAEVLGRKLEFDAIRLTNEAWLNVVWGQIVGKRLIVTYQLKNTHDFFASFSSGVWVLAVPQSSRAQVLDRLKSFTNFRMGFESIGTTALTRNCFSSSRVFNVTYWVVD